MAETSQPAIGTVRAQSLISGRVLSVPAFQCPPGLACPPWAWWRCNAVPGGAPTSMVDPDSLLCRLGSLPGTAMDAVWPLEARADPGESRAPVPWLFPKAWMSPVMLGKLSGSPR